MDAERVKSACTIHLLRGQAKHILLLQVNTDVCLSLPVATAHNVYGNDYGF